MTGPALRAMMQDIIDRAGASYEFVFLTAPYAVDGTMPGSSTSTSQANWIRDPPGGKGSHTQESDWDAASLAAIDAVVAAQGPFFGILGYSQGTAATLSYLSHASAGTFTVGLAFCAYMPTTHDDIVARINGGAPYSLPMYVYMSENDLIIDNCMTNAFASKFSSPTRASSDEGSHAPPSLGQEGFNAVFEFLAADHAGGSYTPPAPAPSELIHASCPSFLGVLLRLYWWFLLLVALCLGASVGGCMWTGCFGSTCCGQKDRRSVPRAELVLANRAEGAAALGGET
jgi:hypothetical protein